MSNRIEITVTGDVSADREMMQALLQLLLRRAGVVPAMDVEAPGAVMTRAADDMALNQDLQRFVEAGGSVKITDR